MKVHDGVIAHDVLIVGGGLAEHVKKHGRLKVV